MNIEQARFNMIEQQIRPWNVLDQTVLEMLDVLKRENFFPEAQKNLVFGDTELPLAAGVHSLSPKMEARILQEVLPKKHEQVLQIGAGSGYLAALLAYKSRHVDVIEIQPELKTLAEANLSKNAVDNVHVTLGDGLAVNTGTQYDLIVLSGSVDVVPDSLLQQIKVGGRLFAVIGLEPVMSATIITRESDSKFVPRKVFETVVPALRKAHAHSTFSF
jgi:protein-L-isoaspartate(D-aspartate) O-methyltransferase